MRSSHALLAVIAVLVAVVLGWWLVGGESGDGGEPAAVETAVDAGRAHGAGAPAEDEPAAEALPAPSGGGVERTAVVGAAAEPRDVAAPRDLRRRVVGRVVDRGGRPVEGASVRLDLGAVLALADEHDLPVGLALEDEATTDAEGRFALTEPPRGRLRLSVRAAGYAPLVQRSLTLPPEGEHDLGDLELAEGALLSGRVVDAAGRPVEGARLFDAHGQEGFVTTGMRSARPLAVTLADGSFRVESLACGGRSSASACPTRSTRTACSRGWRSARASRSRGSSSRSRPRRRSPAASWASRTSSQASWTCAPCASWRAGSRTWSARR